MKVKSNKELFNSWRDLEDSVSEKLTSACNFGRSLVQNDMEIGDDELKGYCIMMIQRLGALEEEVSQLRQKTLETINYANSHKRK